MGNYELPNTAYRLLFTVYFLPFPLSPGLLVPLPYFICLTIFAIYFPIISNSRFTTVPTLNS